MLILFPVVIYLIYLYDVQTYNTYFEVATPVISNCISAKNSKCLLHTFQFPHAEELWEYINERIREAMFQPSYKLSEDEADDMYLGCDGSKIAKSIITNFVKIRRDFRSD